MSPAAFGNGPVTAGNVCETHDACMFAPAALVTPSNLNAFAFHGQPFVVDVPVQMPVLVSKDMDERLT